jgi:Spy/CpxP family protein refolding chaperone
LQLTTDQIQKIGTLQEKFFEETSGIRNQLRSTRWKFKMLRSESEIDDAAIIKNHKEVFNLQEKLLEKSLSYQKKARSILTDEQIASLPLGCTFGFDSGGGCANGYTNKNFRGCGMHQGGCGR